MICVISMILRGIDTLKISVTISRLKTIAPRWFRQKSLNINPIPCYLTNKSHILFQGDCYFYFIINGFLYIIYILIMIRFPRVKATQGFCGMITCDRIMKLFQFLLPFNKSETS